MRSNKGRPQCARDYCTARFEEDISDPYRKFVAKDERYFQGLYLKLVRSRNAKVKRFSALSARIVITPVEICHLCWF